MKILQDFKKVKSVAEEIKKYYPRSYLFLVPTKDMSPHFKESIMSGKSPSPFVGSFKAVNGGNHGFIVTRCPCCKQTFNYYKQSPGPMKEQGKVRCNSCINSDLNQLDQDYNKTLIQRESYLTKFFNWKVRRIIKSVGLRKK